MDKRWCACCKERKGLGVGVLSSAILNSKGSDFSTNESSIEPQNSELKTIMPLVAKYILPGFFLQSVTESHQKENQDLFQLHTQQG